MQKSNLIQVISQLSKEDRRAFRKFIRSPFHNHREDVQQLFEFIDSKLEKNWKALTKPKAFAAIFPNENYEEKRIRYVMSFLMKCVEDFLGIQEARRDKIESNLQLTKAYRKLKMPKLFQQNWQKTSGFLEKQPFRSQVFYEQFFQLELEKYHFSLGNQRNAPTNLQEMTAAFDLAFLVQKLRQSCLLLAHQSVYKIEYDTGLLPLIINYLEGNEILGKHPAIGVYFYYYQSQQSEKSAFYFQLFQKTVFEHSVIFPKDELRNLYLLAINFCIKKYNKGEQQYLQEVFEWYKSGLAAEILLENGSLSHFSFKNIAATALRLQEFDWTEKFIENYQNYLPTKYRKTYTHYTLSKLRYNQGNYKEAMQRLQQMEYNDLFLNLDAKVMLLKMYYELEEWEVLDSLLVSFKRYIERSKNLGYHQENYLNIIRFTQKLVEMNPFDKKEKELLKKEIEETEVLGEKGWLLGQF